MAPVRCAILLSNYRVFSKVRIENIFNTCNRNQSTDSAEILVEEQKTYNDIPGPKSYPIIKNLYKLFPPGSWAGLVGLDLMKVIHKDYGDIVRFDGAMGRNNSVFLFNPEYIEKVYRMENQYPIRPGMESLSYFRTKVRQDFFQTAPGLLVSTGKDWQEFRSKINVPMLQPKTVRLYTEVLDEVAKDMVDRLRRLRDKSNKIPCNFGHEMNLWSLESIASVALGTRIGCFQENLKEDSLQNRLIQSVKDIFYLTFRLDFQPSLWKFYPTTNYKKLMNAFRIQMEISEYFINQELKKETEETLDNDGEKAILQKLLKIDKKTAIVMALDMMLAGVDTTANTMVGTLYYLSINQDKQDKLRTEVKEAVERGIDKDRIPYLKACIKESMRLYPITGGNIRRLTKDIVLGEYLIPEKTDVIFAHQFLAVHPSQFKDSQSFAPERWLKVDNEKKSDSTHSFSNMPFGFGSRSCPGRRIAELEMQLFLYRLITSFRFEWKGPPIKTASATLNYFEPPYHFVLTDV